MRDQTDERAEEKVGTAAEPGRPDKKDDAGRSGEDSTARGPAPVSAPEPPADLPVAYRKLLAERDDLYDRLLRKQAELENTRKRLQREKEDFLQHATADLIRGLLPVLDAFERALKHRDANGTEEFYQGVELIYRNLLEVLGRAGLAPIETAAKLFDPHLHQAVETVEAPGHRDQEIVEELQRGYRLRHRLLRPAIVKVAVARKRSSGSSVEDQESGPSTPE